MTSLKGTVDCLQTNACYEILVVEDSSTQAMLLKKTLEKHSFAVSLAKDGLDAMDKIAERRPNLIISDIEMPKLNGFDFCRRVKETPVYAAIPVIILTNLSDSSDVIEGIKSGADSFLTKPYTEEILISTIEDVLQNSQVKSEGSANHSLKFVFRGESHRFNANLNQITNLLLSTYSSALEKNKELEQAYQKLNIVHSEVETANRQLQHLNEQKNFFLGMAAHDLRSPLVAIQGYSELLLEKELINSDPDINKMLSRIQRSSEFMLHLVNDLLDFSAIESGKVKLHLQDTDLHTLIEDCIALSSGQASKKVISIYFKSVPNLPPIRSDQEKLEQVVNNLISNAIKYSAPHTEISVTLSRTSDDVLIAVKDQGVGIAPEDIDKLFNPFTKTDSKATQGEKSTGLGLAISKKIILELGGDIWAESQAGKGASFFVRLPLTGNRA
ncbi:hybrid sensor histidine kinase/response regulator [Estrella lausannensis]|uniref:histidine kinase n=1 Tax=Estrella lausannensis TaxID=483423 RepID=A0A0H5DTT8_9BACT|nr:hybrid sensor histidine kinase/response regulator [Estrella lausannensis]CRX39299.1 two-component system, histidine kinase and response regulator [Estrella lausannensis]